MDREQYEVSVDRARRRFRSEEFSDGEGSDGLVGQERAQRAIEFGLAMGAHMFLVGPAGTGKRTYIQSRLSQWARSRPTPDDWCFVPRFDHAERAQALVVPAGQGHGFGQAVDDFVRAMYQGVRHAFDSEGYAHHRQSILQEFETRQQNLWKTQVEQARQLGFAIQMAPTGQVVTLPLRPDGQPFAPEEFQELNDDIRQSYAERQLQLAEPLEMTLHRIRSLDRDARLALQGMDKEVAQNAVASIVEAAIAPYADLPAAQYFRDIVEDMLRRLDDLRRDEQDDPVPWISRYAIRVVADHDPNTGQPVVAETNPTYTNLFGQIQYRLLQGMPVADVQGIMGGSVLKANGGYLVLMAEDVLREPYVYPSLKRILRQGWISVENAPEPMAWLRPPIMQLDQIPLDLTVILVGPPEIYYALYNIDPDFRRIFKVKADFAADMPTTSENLQRFGQMLRQAARERDWKVPTDGALARLAEYGARYAENQERLTTQFGEVLSVLQEAHVWAGKDHSDTILAEHVDQALDQRRERFEGPASVMHRMIEDKTLFISTEGVRVGQVNGLAVMSAGDAPFGHPSRITATTWVGESGILNIERQTRQSGTTHTKGILTLTGFFSGRFGQHQPLTLSASLAFEQMYDEVDGDSASSAELYALLSALAGIGIDQGIAVTGSVDQYGRVQPIGGVNHKIEGFFNACQIQGLSGKQGVMIPKTNLNNLMISREVEEAIRDGRFHIWAVDNIDQGMEILTGMTSGTPDDGPESIMGRIAKKLREFSNLAARGKDRA